MPCHVTRRRETRLPSDQRRIDDTVLRRLRAALDNEEVRLSGSAAAE
ncbi:hypothetical protein ACFOZ0_13565 [Streptomyces yaanensis]|uniref:Uncharacterized protein n=1 Tax=Streptomyces yaanensis TaxID=1142239 RepID=A0ABV7SBD3_9ACTN|nr:hypothetical protein [Streptomyces sp. CGMCC 4.7035]WNB98872.1 hypothetical protein Q2K21_12745 [Streptomyces sp. CGMCC 4.7035]